MSLNHFILLSCFKLYNVKIFKDEECQKYNKIGQGAVMNVYQGKLNGLPVAVKLSKKKLFKHYWTIAQEIKIMSSIKHPNVITFYGVKFFGSSPGLILELAELSLDRYLRRLSEENMPLDARIKAKFCYEIIMGLQAIHAAGVTFGDLKGENILVCKIGSTRVCKISDFGYSVTALSVSEHKYPGYTLNFVAPEEFDVNLKPFRGQQTGDIYSYGLVVWQIVRNGEVPFEEEEEDLIREEKINGDFLKALRIRISNDPDIFLDVINATTHYMPNMRSSPDNIKSMFEKEFPNIQDLDQVIIAEHEIFSNEPLTHIQKERISDFHELDSIPMEFKKEMFQYNKKSAAKSELAIHYYYGFGVEKNIEEATRLSKEAAEQGDVLSMYNYGYFLKTIDKNDEEANIWFKKAGAEGDIEANLALGHYFTEKGQDDEAIEYFFQAIKDHENQLVIISSSNTTLALREKAINKAYIVIANFYLAQKKFDQARGYYQLAFRNGNHYVLHQIGLTYEGVGEYDTAFAEFKMAVEEHENYAKEYNVELSDIHDSLIRAYRDNPKQSPEHKQYLKQIADSGGEELQYKLASLLIDLEDDDEALEYFYKAASNGHHNAAFYGGYYHYIKEKYDKAEELFLKIVKASPLDVSLQLGFVTLWKNQIFESQCWFLKAVGVDVLDNTKNNVEKKLKKIAIDGDRDAQINITKSNPKKASKWLAKAKRIDESVALALGVLCETGLLGFGNFKKARIFYSRSNKLGRDHNMALSKEKLNARDHASETSCNSTHAKDEMVYKCITCCKNHTVLCSKCFYASKHKSHKVIAYFAPDGESTSCDCGDTSLPDNSLCCRHHGTKTRNILLRRRGHID